MNIMLEIRRSAMQFILIMLLAFLVPYGCGGGGGGGGDGGGTSGQEADVNGSWHLSATEQGQAGEEGPNRLIITQSSPDFTFTIDFIDGHSVSGAGEVAGSDISFSWDEDWGGQTETCYVTGTVSPNGDEMSGTWNDTEGDSGTWRAERPLTTVWIDFRYIQYRVGPNITDEYRGWIDLTKDDGPVIDFDITEVKLKDSSGQEIPIIVSGLSSPGDPFVYGRWNDSTMSIDFMESTFPAGCKIEFDPIFVVPLDMYTYEVTTREQVVLKSEVFYPGRVDLPVVDQADMVFEWDVPNAGDIKMSWQNPPQPWHPGPLPFTYREELRVQLGDDTGELQLWVRLPGSVEELIVQREWVDKMNIPNGSHWNIETRVYEDPTNNNYARGYSAFVPVP